LQDVMPLPSLEKESDLPTSISPDLVSHTSSHKDITEDVQASADQPAPVL